MAVIQVKTLQGLVKLDPADIESLSYRIGDATRVMERPHILEMFQAYIAADEGHQAHEDHRRQMQRLDDEHLKLNEAMRGKLLGGQPHVE